MRNSIWEKRMPTLLGISLILVGIFITSNLAQKNSNLFGFAAPDTTPKNVRFTNITDNSLTVSYLTDASTTGTVSYGITPSLGKIAFDERDTVAKSNAYQMHSITLKALTPTTTYYLAINSGEKTYYSTEQSTTPFTVTTNTSLTNPQEKKVHGTLQFPKNSSSDEAIVYVMGNNSQTISTLSNTDGSYTLDLSQLRTKNGSNFVDLSSQISLQMYVLTPNSHSQIAFLSTATQIPLIIISEPYDFTAIPNINSQNTATNSPQFTDLASRGGGQKQTRIIIPQKDQHFSDQQPLFKGTAPPNTTLQITIHSAQQISTQTTTDSNGNWSYRPHLPLSPGTHTISVTSKNQFGILQTITNSFTVYAAGSEVNQSATPSATLEPLPTPTDTPTPTTILTATPIISFITPSSPPPSPQPSLVTGSNSVIIGGAIAAITTIAGLLLFFGAAAL